MARYNREDYDDLDEYEEEGEEQEDEGGEEEEEEEEAAAARQPTQDELEYLELRQRLKESIRKQMKKEPGSTLANTKEKKKLPYENFGSFFGPSQPVIARRVIQESRSMLENHHLAAKVARPHHDASLKNKSSASTSAQPKAQAPNHQPRGNELKVKVEKLKQTRDYSFLLSDDAELPAPPKDPPPRNVFVPNSEARSAQGAPKGKQSLNKTVRQVPNGHEVRKSVSTGSQRPKAGSHKLNSARRPTLTSVESRKQLGNSNGSGPGRPLGSKDLPPKKPAGASERRVPAAIAKSSPLSAQRPSSKLQSSSTKQPSILKKNMDHKKEFQESRKEKVMPKPQVKKPPEKISSRPTLQESRPKKKAARQYSDDDDDEGGRAISMIRNMFGYNPNRYAGSDEDDSDMEANFDDILEEEDRSARIARKEDAEELRKIEEEERREQLRRDAKRRKLSQR